MPDPWPFRAGGAGSGSPLSAWSWNRTTSRTQGQAFLPLANDPAGLQLWTAHTLQRCYEHRRTGTETRSVRHG